MWNNALKKKKEYKLIIIIEKIIKSVVENKLFDFTCLLKNAIVTPIKYVKTIIC